jgi:3',5'-cyclic AMP phosphodiesterase CpdA
MCVWRKRHPFDVVITVGDNIYDTGSPELFQARFYEPYACLLHHGVRFHAVLGNHDVITDGGRSEIDEPAFGMRGHNFVVKQQGVSFVFADSNSLDRAWLRAALNKARSSAWTIVVFHHPVFSPGTGHGSTLGFGDLPRMFRRRGVDLVLNGHDHIYSVTKKLHGIRYVVTGGGGAPLYGCRTETYAARCVVQNHFLYVTVTGAHAEAEAVPPTGRPFDSFRAAARP